jgi:hypothetical protein
MEWSIFIFKPAHGGAKGLIVGNCKFNFVSRAVISERINDKDEHMHRSFLLLQTRNLTVGADRGVIFSDVAVLLRTTA